MHLKLWSDLFLLGAPLAEKILRPVIVYVFLIVALRLAGKRELAQLNPFDLVVLLTLSNTVQNAIIGEDNSVTGGMIGAATLLVLDYALVRALYNHPKLFQLVEGKPDVLFEDGKVKRNRLKKELITAEELSAAAHRQGFASLHDVDKVILETGGTLTFIGKTPTPDLLRHRELTEKLDQVMQELSLLKAGPLPPASQA
jgi:uncharacterized membrane protein YcaP (DUF421 family)